MLWPDHCLGIKRDIGEMAAATWQQSLSRAKKGLPSSGPNIPKNSREDVVIPFLHVLLVWNRGEWTDYHSHRHDTFHVRDILSGSPAISSKPHVAECKEL
jgi:hypothetical protein